VPIIFKKLDSADDFSQCVDLQRNLFNMSDVDVVSPLMLQLIARENPPMGFALGAFDVSEKKQELIGFVMAMAMLHEKSIYGTMIGIKPQYQSLGYGLNLILKIREIAIGENIDYLYGVYEPLDKKLAHLYINHLGFTGTYYQEDVYYLNDTNQKVHIPTDKILFKWDMKAFSDYDKKKNNSKELLQQYPVATKDEMPDSPYVFVEIPSDFNLLKKENIEEALFWRQSTKDIFTHYINHRNFIVYDYLTIKETPVKKSFYLLKAQ